MWWPIVGLRQEEEGDGGEDADIIGLGGDILFYSLFFPASASLGTSPAVPLPVTTAISSFTSLS